jgi:hypothetical protein
MCFEVRAECWMLVKRAVGASPETLASYCNDIDITVCRMQADVIFADMSLHSPSSYSPTRPRLIWAHMYTVARTSHCSRAYPSTRRCQ